VLEQRVSMNEDSVTQVMDYFREVKDQQRAKRHDILEYNPRNMLKETLGQ